MPYFHSTACLELWFVRSLAWRGHFLSAVLESLYHNTDWQERKGEKEKKKMFGEREEEWKMIVEELSEDDVLNRKARNRGVIFHRNMFLLISLIEFYALVHSVFLLILCLTQRFPLLCLSKTETTKLRLIFTKHCLCTCSAWQAPDDAQLSTPVVPISATSWGHSNYSKSLPTCHFLISFILICLANFSLFLSNYISVQEVRRASPHLTDRS